MRTALRTLLIPQPKSKIKAGEGTTNGIYKFFTSSPMQSKYFHEATYDRPALIFGTGGNASVHFCTEPFSTSTDCLVMYGSTEANLELIYQYLRTNIHILQAGFKGAGLQHISKDYILDIEIDFPDEGKQASLTDQVRKIDHMLCNYQQQLAKLNELVKSRFVEMFGDPDTNPMQWQESPLSDHLDVIGGYAFKSEGFAETGIPVLRIGNINSGHFLPVNMVFWHEDHSLQRYKMYPGDLVMSLTGTVGKDDYGNVCILGDDYDEYYLNQRNAKLHLKHTLNKHYLAEMLKFNEIKKRLTGISRGVRQANISNKDILSLVVPIPPIVYQNQFAVFVEQTDKSKLAVQQSIDQLETLKKSLMQQYFG